MATSLNKVQLIGRLGDDPQCRSTNSGQSVSNFSVATDETYKDRNEETQKRTEWHKIVVWGNAVDNFVAKYLHKGDLVYIEGKLQSRTWEDKRDGSKHNATEVIVTDIKKLNYTDDKSGKTTKTTAGKTTQRAATQQRAAEPTSEISDEDILF